MTKNSIEIGERLLATAGRLSGESGGPPRSELLQSDIDRLLRGAEAGKPRSRAPLPRVAPASCVCRIDSADAGGHLLAVTDEGIEHAARAAVSCLVQPRAGDLVHLLVRGEHAWVTAVLERSAQDADVVVDFGNSGLDIRARSISLHAKADLEIEAHQTSNRSVVSVTACEERHANITGTDSISANCTLIHTDGHMGLHAGNTSITANSLIKIDAGQVHMC